MNLRVAVSLLFVVALLSQPAGAQTFKPRRLQYDLRLVRAAEIALARAQPRKTWRCWHFVKDALLDAGVIASRPQTAWAKQAGDELCRKYGFTRLDIKDPFAAPVGAVI